MAMIRKLLITAQLTAFVSIAKRLFTRPCFIVDGARSSHLNYLLIPSSDYQFWSSADVLGLLGLIAFSISVFLQHYVGFKWGALLKINFFALAISLSFAFISILLFSRVCPLSWLILYLIPFFVLTRFNIANKD